MKYILTILIAVFFVPIGFADVKTETVVVLMRDGVKLATDVYRDENVKQAPVIVVSHVNVNNAEVI